MESNVKCPECGFVSSSVPPECEQCGHRFRLASHSETLSPPSRAVGRAASSPTFWEPPTPASGAAEEVEAPDSQNAVATVARDGDRVPDAEKGASGEPWSDPAPAAQSLQNSTDPTVTEEHWRNDLTQHVQRFRRRRANLRGPFDAETSLGFDFHSRSGGETDTPSEPALAHPAQPSEEFDAVLRAHEQVKENIQGLDSIPLRGRTETLEFPRGAVDADAEGLRVETRRRRRLDPAALSIVMESPSTDESEAAPAGLSVAPLGRRFLDGVADGLVLLFALACFVAIFWWVVGARLHWRPVDLGVLGFVAGFFVLFYFALFGRLAAATVGQQAVGLVLRNLEGGTPTPAQAFWRAFGYLVSLSALMLDLFGRWWIAMA
jgi:uncharacterized RDD family membrane protein YckC